MKIQSACSLEEYDQAREQLIEIHTEIYQINREAVSNLKESLKEALTS